MALVKHPLALQAGHVDKTVNLSVQGLWTVEGFLNDPPASTWLLESRGITKEKRIIVTCNTGQQAAGAWFALKYIGYPNVIVHDGSWVSWERSPMMKKLNRHRGRGAGGGRRPPVKYSRRCASV